MGPGAKIDRIILSGVRTEANYRVVNGKLSLDFEGVDANGSVAVNLEDLPKADNDGLIRFETPLLVAVFPRDDESDAASIKITARSTDVNVYLNTKDVYTLSLGPKRIDAGKYYFIPTKRLKVPSVKVENDEEIYELFASLEDASEYINHSASGSFFYVELLRDCTTEGPVTFKGTQEGQTLEFYGYYNTLTLSGGPIVMDGLSYVSISSGHFVQTSDQPLLSVLSGVVSLDDDASYDGTASSKYLIQVSGTGEVCVASGHYDLNAGGLLLTSDNEGPSFVQGGRFSEDPQLDGVDNDSFGFYRLDIDQYPYICLEDAAFENLAHTANRILKTTTIDGDGNKVIFTRNNLYNNIELGEYGFVGPGWEEDSYPGDFYFEHEIGSSECVGSTLYSRLSSSQWCDVLYRSYDDPSFMKCKVKGFNNETRNYLVIFPDLIGHLPAIPGLEGVPRVIGPGVRLQGEAGFFAV